MKWHDGVDDTDVCCLRRCTSIEEPVFLHRGSVLRKDMPQYVAYQEIYETNKLYMRGEWSAERREVSSKLTGVLLGRGSA